MLKTLSEINYTKNPSLLSVQQAIFSIFVCERLVTFTLIICLCPPNASFTPNNF